MRKLEDLAGEFESLEACCMHEAQWRPQDAESLIAWRFESPEGWASTDQLILMKLKDGGFGLLTSRSDTTGHGCRCGAYTVRTDTLTELLGKMTEDELLDLIRDREEAD